MNRTWIPGDEASRERAMVSPEIMRHKLGTLLGFWLEMPMQDYLDELERIGPAIAAAIRHARFRPARRSARLEPVAHSERVDRRD